MIAFPAPYLEMSVLVSGMAILVCETFIPSVEKKFFAYAGIVSLLLVFLASFFLASPPSGTEGGALWNFYAADALSIFFKRFMLVTTIIVLVMMIDYAPTMRA